MTDAGGHCWDCVATPTENLEHMFVGLVQTSRIEQGQRPAQRPVFLKPHGVAYGRFEPVADLPHDLKVGVFALEPRAAWVRFPSDTVATPRRRPALMPAGTQYLKRP